MDNPLQKALLPVTADEALKARTRAFLTAERQKRERPAGARHTVRWAVAAACCLVAIVLIGGFSLYAMPVAYIGVDINPSVELGVNLFSRVVSQQGYNDDGVAVLEMADVQNLRYDEAVTTLLRSPLMAECLDRDASALTITVVADGDTQAQMLGVLQQEAPQATCAGADTDSRLQAQAAGLSVGKYRLYEQLHALGDPLTPDECRRTPMAQLRERLAAYGVTDSETENSGDASPSGQGGQGDGQGSGSRYQYGKK